jgi:cytokinesis protein
VLPKEPNSLILTRNIQSARRLSEAGQALLNAKHFKELLSVSLTNCMWGVRWLTLDHQLILLIGNYMNGTGVKGGAFGFRVSSINKVR